MDVPLIAGQRRRKSDFPMVKFESPQEFSQARCSQGGRTTVPCPEIKPKGEMTPQQAAGQSEFGSAGYAEMCPPVNSGAHHRDECLPLPGRLNECDEGYAGRNDSSPPFHQLRSLGTGVTPGAT